VGADLTASRNWQRTTDHCDAWRYTNACRTAARGVARSGVGVVRCAEGGTSWSDQGARRVRAAPGAGRSRPGPARRSGQLERRALLARPRALAEECPQCCLHRTLAVGVEAVTQAVQFTATGPSTPGTEPGPSDGSSPVRSASEPHRHQTGARHENLFIKRAASTDHMRRSHRKCPR
jgi:hypothetical protein